MGAGRRCYTVEFLSEGAKGLLEHPICLQARPLSKGTDFVGHGSAHVDGYAHGSCAIPLLASGARQLWSPRLQNGLFGHSRTSALGNALCKRMHLRTVARIFQLAVLAFRALFHLTQGSARVSVWNKDSLGGVIGVRKGPLC